MTATRSPVPSPSSTVDLLAVLRDPPPGKIIALAGGAAVSVLAGRDELDPIAPVHARLALHAGTVLAWCAGVRRIAEAALTARDTWPHRADGDAREFGRVSLFVDDRCLPRAVGPKTRQRILDAAGFARESHVDLLPSAGDRLEALLQPLAEFDAHVVRLRVAERRQAAQRAACAAIEGSGDAR